MEAGASGPPPGPIFSLGPQSDGRCFCKAHVCSRTCAACKDGFFGLDQANYFGCRSAFLPAGSPGPIRGGQGPEGAGRPGPQAGPSVARPDAGWVPGQGGRKHGLCRPPSPPSCAPQTSPTALVPSPLSLDSAALSRAPGGRPWEESCLLCPLLWTRSAEPQGPVWKQLGPERGGGLWREHGGGLGGRDLLPLL